MITLDDIEDMTCLSREEIAAVAEHEHLPEVSASALAEYTMHLPKGPQAVQQMICEDLRDALHRDDLDHARALYVVLHGFLEAHPEAVRGSAPK
ncbi:MAG: hypothetical protein ACQEVT_09420 [Pseudomonadota bacterium]|uniref:hypothetical protein n=1 Tax=Roseovarius TaxID=74030 RepID=UPI0022A8B639|nr:hypothetical protein [Roseovarius sp. EGI FJ00037]MCZ0812961.1 hypothetical protein [Roseovarius sp. EGI FJ00037]